MSRGQRTRRFAVGLITAVCVAGGGWWSLREPSASFGDLDRTESLRAGEYDEPVPTENPTGALGLPDEAPFTIPGTRVEYRIEANAAQASVYGLPAERVRTWGLLVLDDEPIERDAVVAAMDESGALLDANQVEIPASEFVTVTGTWNGMLLLVSVHRGETITVTLVDR